MNKYGIQFCKESTQKSEEACYKNENDGHWMKSVGFWKYLKYLESVLLKNGDSKTNVGHGIKKKKRDELNLRRCQGYGRK